MDSFSLRNVWGSVWLSRRVVWRSFGRCGWVALALWGSKTTGFFSLCTYNIHEGGHGTEELFQNFFVPECDVAVINEANGWRQKNVAQVAERYGFDLDLLATPTTYDIGVLAKRNVVNMRRGTETSAGRQSSTHLHHGVLHCELTPLGDDTRPVHLLATHLTPHSTIRRREEARRLVALVQRLEGEGFGANRHAVILAGDLNTLSPLDKEDHVALVPILLGNPRLRAKFLVPGHTETQGEIDYMPMRILLAELVDVAVAHDKRRKPHPTVPTALHVDKLHAAPMRLDYILFNDAAAAHLLSPTGEILEVNALRDAFTDSASDHYPLIVTRLADQETRARYHDSSNDAATNAQPLRADEQGEHLSLHRDRSNPTSHHDLWPHRNSYRREPPYGNHHLLRKADFLAECDHTQYRDQDGRCHPPSQSRDPTSIGE